MKLEARGLGQYLGVHFPNIAICVNRVSNKHGSKYLSEFIKPLMHDILEARGLSNFSPLVEAMGSDTSSISPERDLHDLHGRVAIVTGAKLSSGIGLYIALDLVRSGAKVEHAIRRMEEEGMGKRQKGEPARYTCK